MTMRKHPVPVIIGLIFITKTTTNNNKLPVLQNLSLLHLLVLVQKVLFSIYPFCSILSERKKGAEVVGGWWVKSWTVLTDYFDRFQILFNFLNALLCTSCLSSLLLHLILNSATKTIIESKSIYYSRIRKINLELIYECLRMYI